ncbi:caspase family protein [Streptomyces sp. NPDC050315]|uniref:caspase family protein n=1 Tax=Streptomyces sp. NPDC050315 TaxID=3155039 RepID=UPI00342D0A4A
MTATWFPDGATSRVVCIGADTYHSAELPPIPAVRNNLTDLRNALTHSGHGLFAGQDADAGHCTVLGLDDGPPVDQAAIGQALSRAAHEATDLLLVYYSGHGLLDDDGMLYLALPHTDRSRLTYTALSLAHIKRDLADARARARVLILDCCFSGRAIEAMATPTDLVLGQLPVTGTYTLTSTTETTPSYAPCNSRNSAFTGALLTALTAPEPLALDEIYQHVDTTLSEAGLPGPRRRVTGHANRLALARGPVPIPPGSGVVAPPRVAADRRGMWGRLGIGTRAGRSIALVFAAVVTGVVVALTQAGDGGGEAGGSGKAGGGGASDGPGGPAHVLRTVVSQWTHYSPDTKEASHAGTLNAGGNYFYCKEKGESYKDLGRSTNWWLRTDDDEGNRNVYVSAVSLDEHSYATFQDELPDCE